MAQDPALVEHSEALWSKKKKKKSQFWPRRLHTQDTPASRAVAHPLDGTGSVTTGANIGAGTYCQLA